MKLNTKVILKTEKYVDNKYNPRSLHGVVIDLEGPILPIKVEWSNGVRNGYYEKELEIVADDE